MILLFSKPFRVSGTLFVKVLGFVRGSRDVDLKRESE